MAPCRNPLWAIGGRNETRRRLSARDAAATLTGYRPAGKAATGFRARRRGVAEGMPGCRSFGGACSSAVASRRETAFAEHHGAGADHPRRWPCRAHATCIRFVSILPRRCRALNVSHGLPSRMFAYTVCRCRLHLRPTVRSKETPPPGTPDHASADVVHRGQTGLRESGTSTGAMLFNEKSGSWRRGWASRRTFSTLIVI